MKAVCLFFATALALPGLLLGQTCTVTSPTASQMLLAAAPVQLTATVSSAPTAYSLEYDIDYRRWRKAYNADQHPIIGDFGDNWQGPWVATWYSGLYGDGQHVVSGILRDIFDNTLATCPAVSFTVNIEGMPNNSINLLPNLSGNTISGTGALGILTFDGHNRATGPYIDGRPLNLSSGQLCGTSGGTSQTPAVPGTGGSQVPSFITTCGITNGLHLISYGYGIAGISDPYIVNATVSNINGSSLAFSPWHFSTQTTATNPDVVTFTTSGSIPTGLAVGSQWFSPASGHWGTAGAGTVTVAASGSNLVLTTSVAHGASSGTSVAVRNLSYSNQANGVAGCDGLYTAGSGTTGTTINLPMSATCPNGTIVSATAANPGTITLSGTLPGNGDLITIAGLTGMWANLNGNGVVSLVSGSTYTFGPGTNPHNYSPINTTGYGALTGSGVYVPHLFDTANIEADINPFFTNYIDATHVSVSASPSGSSPISPTGGSGTLTMSQRIRSPYWSGANTQVNVNFVDYAEFGGPALVTKQVTVNNGAGTPMEIRPPNWEYHGWPGKTGDTIASVIENTDLTSTACSACTYSITADGTVTGAISLSGTSIVYNPTSSWSNPSAPTAWAKATVTCTSCSVGVTSVTVYIEEDPGSAPVYPHWTTCGTIASTFTTGSCHSFFPLSIQSVVLDTNQTPGWIGPGVYQNSHFNSALVGMEASNPGAALVNPTSGSCPTWPDSNMTSWETFATTYGIRLDYDLYDIFFNFWNGWGQNGGGLPAILANTGYNRQACLTQFVQHLVSSGLYWRFHHDDEVTDELTGVLRMTPTIQNAVNTTWGSGVTSVVVSGTGITFNVTNPSGLAGNWSQSAGTGSWIQVLNATNTCLNGWYPILTNSSTAWTSNNNGGCANGTYEPSGGTTETTLQISVNPSGLTSQQNISALPSNLSAVHQAWSSALTSIVVSSCVATVHWTSHGIAGGQAIRIWNATTANLNIVAPIGASPPANTFTFTYPNIGTGEACPANGTYNSSTDASLYITVDPNWGVDPLGSFDSIVRAVSGHPGLTYSMLGSFYGGPSNVYSYEGNPTNVDASYVYTPNAPYYYLGDSAGVYQWANSDTAILGNSGGLSTRAYMLKPRSVLWPWGVVGGGSSFQTTCRSFTFNPGCDHPNQLIWRPEDITAEILGQKTHDYAGMVNYTLAEDVVNGYQYNCCGWYGSGLGGGGNSPYIAPKAWKAAALANTLLTLRSDTTLQPEGNKPYFGPYFTTDAHFSATYGNELQIVCGSESPYGQFPVTLPRISGGSMLKYILTGYSLSMTVMSGNPSTDTDEFCGMPGNPTIAAPGRTTTYVALPASPAVQPVDTITLAPPATLPFGASKFLVQVGYYPNAMQDDPVTDCTTPCTIAIDHHNLDAYYRVIYADSNDLPRGIGDPVKIPNQGLF